MPFHQMTDYRSSSNHADNDIQVALDEMRRSLELSTEEKEEASYYHNLVRDKLQGTLGGCMGSFLTGSYARHTAIAPLKDIDVFVVLDQEDRRDLFDGTAWRCINAVRAATKDALPRLAQEPRLQKRSIGVGFATAGLRVELVPAFTTGQEGVFRIADRHADRWILSAPQIHTEISTEANQRSGGHLKPVIKMLKAWKRQHNLPIKSFHLEVMCYRAPISPSHTLSEALTWAFSYLSQAIVFPCPDPARVGDPLDIDMTPQERKQMAFQLSRCAKSSVEALDLESRNPVWAHNRWCRIFGELYPREDRK